MLMLLALVALSTLIGHCLMTSTVLNVGDQSPSSPCSFPVEWRSVWYESRLGLVNITTDEIDRKGVCVDQQDNYYLLENREIKCFFCLLAQERHRNVLQYKESYCSGKETLQTLCSTIQAETLLHTLIRVDGGPVVCPLQSAYHFSYNNNSGGICRNPMSYAKPCSSQSKLLLQFQRCSDAAYTHDREFSLECLGSWRDEASNYMIGRFSAGKTINKDGHLYRCFIYRRVGSVMFVSMSADASCRGLRSAQDGPVQFDFTQDTFGWPKPTCTFPPWLAKANWRDLSGKFSYQLTSANDVIEVRSRLFAKLTLKPRTDVSSTFRCISLLRTTNTTVEYLSFTTRGCYSGYQCLRLVKRKEGVVEITEGRFMEFATDYCASHNYQLNYSKRILIHENSTQGTHRFCPFQGRFEILMERNHCSGYFSFGCEDSQDRMLIVSNCSTPTDFVELRLNCLKSWREGKKRLLLATFQESDVVNCFGISRVNDRFRFAIDSNCNGDSPHPFHYSRLDYHFHQQQASCEQSTNIDFRSPEVDVRYVNDSGSDQIIAPEAFRNGDFAERAMKQDDHKYPSSSRSWRNSSRCTAICLALSMVILIPTQLLNERLQS